MKHIQKFQPRRQLTLSTVNQNDWRLKRYAILATGRKFSETTASAATAEAFRRLPAAGRLDDESGNHSIGFQIIHFAETAVVSPVFYWQWGSVLAHIDQLRASWDNPSTFGDGKTEVFGCVWEMEIITFEVAAWQAAMLTDNGNPIERLARYCELHIA